MTQQVRNSLSPSSGGHCEGESISFSEARSIKRDLIAEFRSGLEQGEPIQPEDLLPRWPTDPKDDLDFASVLFADYNRRQQRGEKPSVDDYNQRFPEHENSLSCLISRHQLLASLGTGGSGAGDSKGPMLGLPDVGDEVFGFRLRSELGRGAFARVFMGEQASLAGRPVVLKISGVDGDEPYTLAQLQHTNVVPIYSVHEDARAGLRALCMPYFGGASLSSVLRTLWAGPSPPSLGAQLVDALQTVEAPPPEETWSMSREAWGMKREATHHDSSTDDALRAMPHASTPRGQMKKWSYVQASAWIVARLAEGLQHAHSRGILHRDIKPSNVLLGSDGQPMLLDFNLARDQNGDQAKAEATLGGTVAYMSPEHLRALAHPSAASAHLVDHRSDIYSLGMVLFEMLTGQSPFDQSASYSILPVVIEAMALERSQATPSVRKQQPTVPWSLESIVRKCLAPDPSRRYQQAEDLAEDLRRFLEDRPLKYAPELSRADRIRRWMRRHPRLTSSASVATVAGFILATLVASLIGLRHHLASAEEELIARQDRERKDLYIAGTEKALCLINTVSEWSGGEREAWGVGRGPCLQENLQLGMEMCEETLERYGVVHNPNWQEDARWQRLDADDRKTLGEDTRELLLLLAWGRVRSSPKDPVVLGHALQLLEKAETIGDLAPSKAVWMDRARYLRDLGELDQAQSAQQRADRLDPVSARDHYLLATAYARKEDAGNLQKAIASLNRALELNPRHYWSWVQRGICYQELGELTLAANDFSTCTGLWPEFSWGYFNKGFVLDQSGHKLEAVEAYTQALARDANFVLAYVNRGLVRLQLKQDAEALADFQRALAMGRDDAFLHTGRGVALEALGKIQEADAAFQTAFAKSESAPESIRNRIRWVYAFAISARLPEKAREIFDVILKDDPSHPQALYGRGMLAVEQGKTDEGIQYFEKALKRFRGLSTPAAHGPSCGRGNSALTWPCRISIGASKKNPGAARHCMERPAWRPWPRPPTRRPPIRPSIFYKRRSRPVMVRTKRQRTRT